MQGDASNVMKEIDEYEEGKMKGSVPLLKKKYSVLTDDSTQ
jgi:hypothetical protein